MNCQAGDLALVIKPYFGISGGQTYFIDKGYLGKVVRVTHLTCIDPPHWQIETPFTIAEQVGAGFFVGTCIGIFDDHLRPLRGLFEDEHIEQPVGEVA